VPSLRTRQRGAAPLRDAREAYRILHANLAVAMADLASPSVVVTSAHPGEGKTVTAVNLARSLALSGQRVVLVDLDLRHPDANRVIGTHNEFGATEALLGQRPLEECLQYVKLPSQPGGAERGLYVLATGSPVANPTELLGSQRTAQLLELLAKQADAVIIDTPPVLPVADTLVLGRMVAGALIVVQSRVTPLADVERTRNALTRSQTRILGLVLNKFQPGDANTQFGYGYGYGYGGDDSEAPGDPPASDNGDH
jgi:receptor protein-tyrosine kinase